MLPKTKFELIFVLFLIKTKSVVIIKQSLRKIVLLVVGLRSS